MQLAIDRDTIAEAVGHRLADEGLVRSCLTQVSRTARFPAGWDARSVAMGPLGSALVFESLLDAPGSEKDGWAARSDAILEDCFEPVVHAVGDDDSLFGGSPGALLAYATATTRHPQRWEMRTAALADDIADAALSAAPVTAIDDVADADYDIISGRAGVLMALAAARNALPDTELRTAATNRLFDDLHDLLRRGERVGDGAVISPQHYPLPEYAEQFPHGYLNLGLAHGIPGVLLALSSIETNGARADPRRALVRDLSQRILGAARLDAFGLTWSTGIASPDPGAESSPHAEPSPNAWCYGAPGVALALHRAGAALGDHALTRQARVVMRDALVRHAHTRTARSPSLCHGLAGILACADSVLGHSHGAVGPHAALRAELLARADPDVPLLYRDVEEPGQLLDDPSVIQGAAGIALVVAAREGRPRPAWRNLFGF